MRKCVYGGACCVRSVEGHVGAEGADHLRKNQEEDETPPHSSNAAVVWAREREREK